MKEQVWLMTVQFKHEHGPLITSSRITIGQDPADYIAQELEGDPGLAIHLIFAMQITLAQAERLKATHRPAR